jgi:hypothetical protein
MRMPAGPPRSVSSPGPFPEKHQLAAGAMRNTLQCAVDWTRSFSSPDPFPTKLCCSTVGRNNAHLSFQPRSVSRKTPNRCWTNAQCLAVRWGSDQTRFQPRSVSRKTLMQCQANAQGATCLQPHARCLCLCPYTLHSNSILITPKKICHVGVVCPITWRTKVLLQKSGKGSYRSKVQIT